MMNRVLCWIACAAVPCVMGVAAEPAAPQSPPASPEALRVAFLVPPATSGMAAIANVVRDGVKSNCAARGACQLIEIEYTPQTADVALEEAALSGADVVVGPLGREDASALSNVPIPTVALGEIQSGSTPGPLVVTLELASRVEAEQIVEHALSDGASGRTFLVVEGEAPQDARIAKALSNALEARGVTPQRMLVSQETLYKAGERLDPAQHTDVFLALSIAEAVLVRPRLDRASKVYATSNVNPGSTDMDPGVSALVGDLVGVTLVDAPWVIDSNSEALAAFPRPEQPMSAFRNRLFAWGIDAMEVARHWCRLQPKFSFSGATGTISYDVAASPVGERQAEVVTLGERKALLTTAELGDRAEGDSASARAAAR